jgi:phage FluMu protein Com
MKSKDFRCSNCGRLLFKGELLLGNIQVKCRCHAMNEFIEGIDASKTVQESYGLTPSVKNM